jgi:hypothetical protein
MPIGAGVVFIFAFSEVGADLVFKSFAVSEHSLKYRAMVDLLISLFASLIGTLRKFWRRLTGRKIPVPVPVRVRRAAQAGRFDSFSRVLLERTSGIPDGFGRRRW